MQIICQTVQPSGLLQLAFSLNPEDLCCLVDRCNGKLHAQECALTLPAAEEVNESKSLCHNVITNTFAQPLLPLCSSHVMYRSVHAVTQVTLTFSNRFEDKCLRKHCIGLLQTPVKLVNRQLLACQAAAASAERPTCLPCGTLSCSGGACSAVSPSTLDITVEDCILATNEAQVLGLILYTH